jgi:hypothetical protein
MPARSSPLEFCPSAQFAHALRVLSVLDPRPEVYYFPGSLEDQGTGLSSVHAKLVVVDMKRVYVGSATSRPQAEWTCITMKSASRMTDQAQIPNPFKSTWFGSPSNAWIRVIALQVGGMF